MERAEVLVVGGGPAGSTVADRLASAGHDVLVIEEHGRIGYPVQCAGLVSSRVLQLAGSKEFVRAPVHGATVLAPSLRSISFRSTEPRAFVIDRAGLDIALADKAARSGARFETGTRFDGVSASDGKAVRVRATRSDGAPLTIETELVIGADGVASAVARAFRLRRPVEILPAFEAEFPVSPGDPDRVEVYLGNAIAPGLFGWWIPDGAGGARVGVAASAGPVTARAYYDRLVAQVGRHLGAPLQNPTSFLVSGIPIGTVPKTHGERVLLVGDAAAQVKPLSGGGIFTGMRCAEIAAEVAHAALQAGAPTEAALRPYEERWRGELGEEFRRALYLRKVFLRLTDAELEQIVAALDAGEMRASIVAFGDIDFPSHVARQLLRQSPSLLRLFPKAVGAWLGSSGVAAPDLLPGPARNA
ncbi:MAG: NAD(P)/FAD-dependent oxidoreductase [Thermoplasmata archaeon]|nr:NAD(P)/FAD-dependent oxidoreductase [Thermoplasmata archaeon]